MGEIIDLAEYKLDCQRSRDECDGIDKPDPDNLPPMIMLRGLLSTTIDNGKVTIQPSLQVIDTHKPQIDPPAT